MVSHNYWIYILSSPSGTLYIGVTNNLERRIYEHKQGLVKGFTRKYHCKKLVYYEAYSNINEAIQREKQIKGWKRYKKEDLIKSLNPSWLDLSLSF